MKQPKCFESQKGEGADICYGWSRLQKLGYWAEYPTLLALDRARERGKWSEELSQH